MIKTKGLYILTSPICKENHIKHGMSMRLEHRWYDYEIPVDFLVQYSLPTSSKEEIFYIETEILNITIEYQLYEHKKEWRKMYWGKLDKIVIQYLKDNKIK